MTVSRYFLCFIAFWLAISIYAGEFQRDIPAASWEWTFFRDINALTTRAGWQPLREHGLPAGSLEVRVWIGFGVTPLEGFRLRRDGSTCTAFHVLDSIKKSQPAQVKSVSPRSDWDALWKRLFELHLLTLPDSSLLAQDETMILDGESYVVEVNSGDHYRTYEYSNPQFRALPEAKDMVEIVDVLRHQLVAQ